MARSPGRAPLGRVLIFAIGGVAVGAVIVTALIVVGLTRLGAPQRLQSQLRTEASRVAQLASGIPCAEGTRPGLAARELGPQARFIPDLARGRPREFGAQPDGRAVVAGREVVYASQPTMLCGRSGTLYVFRPAAEAEPLPEGFGSRLVIAALAALLVSALVAYAIARRVSRPLRELASSARSLARGDVNEPSPPRGSDPAEVAELKEAFNGMVIDLQAAREREKAFFLSVSHELRTPLTAIRGYAEALADGTTRRTKHAGTVMLGESQRLERLVQDLLDLGRLEAGEFSIDARDTDLSEVGLAVVDALQPAAKQVGVSLDLVTEGPSVVHADPDRVHQMVANLVENAIRVTPASERVRVEIQDGCLAVTDSGPGLDPEDFAHAFERFYLWRKYRGERPVGSGLGLAIVGELAQRMDIGLDVSSDGQGSRFGLTFPDA
jgi:two-component system OmpR family sensor kinase